MTPQIWTSDVEPAHAVERVMPSAAVQLLFDLDSDAMHWFDAATPRKAAHRVASGATINGPFARPFCISTRAQRRLVGVVLPPGSAQAWLGLPAHLLSNQHIAINELPALRGLRQRLLETPWQQVPDVLRAELQTRLTPTNPCMTTRLALPQLAAGQGVGAVADALGVSVKRLRRRFHAAVGLTPKQFQRVARFRRTLDCLARNGHAPGGLAALALDMGYTDQAHMTHEFRTLGATTPARYHPRAPDEAGHVAI